MTLVFSHIFTLLTCIRQLYASIDAQHASALTEARAFFVQNSDALHQTLEGRKQEVAQSHERLQRLRAQVDALKCTRAELQNRWRAIVSERRELLAKIAGAVTLKVHLSFTLSLSLSLMLT